MRAAIIDLDGTILDSLGMWSRIDREFLEVRRGIPVPEDYARTIAHMTYRQTAEYTIARFGLPDEPEPLMAEWEKMAEEEYRSRLRLRPYAREFLTRLRQMGVRTALCTSSPESYYSPALKRLGVYGLFDAFATTGEVERSKRYPDVYLLAAERVGVPPEDCTAFEDIPDAILGAKKAGMRAVGVYEPRSAGETEKMRRICDAYIMTLDEFFKLEMNK